ncbi:unnamed protein product [Clonostachys rosea]|uniref:Nuf2 DHR10-like domain-containing protein n=1 Tax=Bionectria ochroleuca TaxID=29856 RepID=A0ABY6U6Q1_BIOOC|nr:unnamed protein product [Clonostachys rosea]
MPLHNSSRQPRKSRYATLPTEVDTALRVLYRKFELATEARQKVTHLESELSRLRQELSLREKEIGLAQNAVEAGNISRKELAKLRRANVQSQAYATEVADLKAEKQHLQVKLQQLQSHTDEIENTMQQWRRDLKGLIGNESCWPEPRSTKIRPFVSPCLVRCLCRLLRSSASASALVSRQELLDSKKSVKILTTDSDYENGPATRRTMALKEAGYEGPWPEGGYREA